MEKLKGVPLESQGISLPRDFPYEGEWLLNDRISYTVLMLRAIRALLS